MMVHDTHKKVIYYKRFRMEIALADAPPPPALPDGYQWVGWEPHLLDQHAMVKYQCFNDEIDSFVFPNLGNREGCYLLMSEIASRAGFRPEATWLVGNGAGYCGTVQGVSDRTGMGAIQNLGVVPAHRGRGLGKALLLKALEGFRSAGLRHAYLEVTARNESAVRMYRQLGFRCRKTMYRAVEHQQCSIAGTDSNTIQTY